MPASKTHKAGSRVFYAAYRTQHSIPTGAHRP
jgi:hypothetical protein